MATVSLYLDERTKKQNGVYPVKLRVTHNRKRLYLKIDAGRINRYLTGELEQFTYLGREGFSIDKITFNRVISEKPRGKYKQLQDIFRAFEIKYQQEADKIEPFNFQKFKNIYETNSGKIINDIFVHLNNKVNELNKEKRFNTATSYKSTLESLKAFSKKKKLGFDSITPKFLTRYRDWMRAKKKSDTTIGIYMRSLRVIMNEAVAGGITNNYPFHSKQNKSGFKIPSGNGRKIALASHELKAIFNHVYENSYSGRFYVDSWKLMYLMQGINARDLCLLKYSNIDGNNIVFTRQKTINSKEPTEITIPISDQIKYYFELWGNPKGKKDNYIWPVLTSRNPEKQTKQVAQFVKLVNKYIDRLAIELEIDKPVTTYVTRHSYATQLMRHGAPVAFISKQLGHSSTGTTDKYLSSFEDEQIKKWQKKITEF